MALKMYSCMQVLSSKQPMLKALQTFAVRDGEIPRKLRSLILIIQAFDHCGQDCLLPYCAKRLIRQLDLPYMTCLHATCSAEMAANSQQVRPLPALAWLVELLE